MQDDSLFGDMAEDSSEIFDLDGDGYAETGISYVDLDGDGIADGSVTYTDTDFDGIADLYGQHFMIDTNGDGITDTLMDQYDANGDGFYEFRGTQIDTDGDGFFETVVTLTDDDGDMVLDHYMESTFLDTDGDHIIDTVTYGNDYDNDGVMNDYYTSYDSNGDGIPDVTVESLMPDYSGVSCMNFNLDSNLDNDNIIGDPASDMENWHCQTYNDTCAVVSQEFVLEELLGEDFDEDELRDIALENGWYTDGGGTPMEHVGDLLEVYGLQVDQSNGGTIDDISACLENGGSVIVGIDADEIWEAGHNDIKDELLGDFAFAPGVDANHAVEVIGIDNSDPDHVMVILNDPGSPDGCGVMIPLEEFQDAWDDSDNFIVTAYK
jgi:hypothetical protein